MTDRNRMTMQDLARLAGVSKMTVSRALRDSSLVSEDVRKRIKSLAREHGYRINVAARDLRLQRRKTIAVVVEMSPTDERPMSEPYPLALLGGIAQELAAADYAMLVKVSGKITDDEVYGSDGVILLGQGAHEDAAEQLGRMGVPLVVWGSPTRAHQYVVVGSDNRHGGQLAAQQLLGAGRRRLVFLGDTDHSELSDRLEGFRPEVDRDGAELVAVEPCDFTSASAFEATGRLLRRGVEFDGVFACNDLAAAGAINALNATGRRVPSAVSVVGYDDAPMAAAYVPAITTIRQNWHSGGRLLARKILQLIRGETPASEALPTSLISRST